MDSPLKSAAQMGDINGLYELIRQDQSIFENVDKSPFTDTPLHIAVSAGHTHFAMELAILKPSLARMLNQDGLSPMHLALKCGHEKIVKGLLAVDNTLIRVKGREGITPLHEVVIAERVELLEEFLSACPDSIEDLTIRRQTALHLAVEYSRVDAFKQLVNWIKDHNKNELFNRKDDDEKTVLELATSINASTNHLEIKMILRRAGVHTESTSAWKIFRYIESHWLKYFRFKMGRDAPNDVRNALLVVAVLITTATYQAGLSPPGGVWQDNTKPNDDNSKIATTLFAEDSKEHQTAGKVIMGHEKFLLFAFFNSAGFYTSLAMIFILTIGFPTRELLHFSLVSLLVTYISSMATISPKQGPNRGFVLLLLLSLPILYIITTVLMTMVLSMLRKKLNCNGIRNWKCLGNKRGVSANDKALNASDGNLDPTNSTVAI